MTDPPDADAPPATPPADRGEVHRDVSDLYSRTWELELLIAGAVTFALLQLPAVVDEWFFSVEPTLTAGSRLAVTYAYEYAKFILYILIAAFVGHLGARAYWVGLIGLDAVFPHGVRWEALSRGPITRAAQRDRQPSLEGLITRTDRFCSIIFSFAFSIVFIFLISVVVLSVTGLLALAVSRIALGGRYLEEAFFTIAGLVALPPVVLGLVDRYYGDRLDPERGVGRVIHRYMSGTFMVAMGAAYSPVFNVLASNIPKKTFITVFYGAFLVLMSFFLVKDVFLTAGLIRLGDHAYLPDRSTARSVDPAYYADQRVEERGFRRNPPQIQSMVIEGPYVHLFIPYSPRRHNDAIARDCPEVPALGGTGLRWVPPRSRREPEPGEVDALFACLRRVQPVEVNGEPVEEPYHFHTDSATGMRGVLVMLPADRLPEGRNLLTVGVVPREREMDDPPPPHHIPFWVDHELRLEAPAVAAGM